MSEIELWNAFRNGNHEAFQRVYQTYAKHLLSYGNRLSSNTSLIEDSVHDLFIELWQSRKNLSETDSIKFYLFRSLRNKINNNRKRETLFDITDIGSACDNPDDFLIETHLIEIEGQQDLLSQLRKGYESLTPRQQQALTLRFYNHFSNEETAQIMGVNYQSACKFIYSGLKSLKESVRILSVLVGLIAMSKVF
jgi:RNA polymerase sigma factor (sigma-70 family)